MNNFELHEALLRIRESAAQHPDMPHEDRERLQALEASIEERLQQPEAARVDGEAGDADGPLVEEAQQLSARFAASHPQAEAALRQLVTILGQIGI